MYEVPCRRDVDLGQVSSLLHVEPGLLLRSVAHLHVLDCDQRPGYRVYGGLLSRDEVGVGRYIYANAGSTPGSNSFSAMGQQV